jgi:hypothetical protein
MQATDNIPLNTLDSYQPLVYALNAVNIFTAVYKDTKMSSYIISDVYSIDEIIEIVMSPRLHFIKPQELYNIWKRDLPYNVKDRIIAFAMGKQYINFLDIFITEKTYMQIIIGAIQECGMYTDLYNLLDFKGIYVEWLSYYLHMELSPESILPSRFILSKSEDIKLSRSFDRWISFFNEMEMAKKKLLSMRGERAPYNIWTRLLANAILYDKKGALLTSVIQEHAQEITQGMVKKMYPLYIKSEREGGWEGFLESMRSLGVPPSSLL